MAKISRLKKDLRADHCGLILFDALNGYLHPRDRTKQAFLEEHNVLKSLKRLLGGAHKAGMTVFYPTGAHAKDGSDTVARLTDTDGDLKPHTGARDLHKPVFSKGSWESQIAKEVAPAANDVVIPKHRWNSFFQTDLDFHLRVRGIDTIIIAGGSTEVGVASTAFSARDMDYGLVIVSDGCYSMRGNNSDFFMKRVFPRMGRVMTVAEAVRLMKK
jgi:ureidoacrylate peracid hydrolase